MRLYPKIMILSIYYPEIGANLKILIDFCENSRYDCAKEYEMSYDLLFNKALSLHDAGQFDEAEKIYRQILETAPNNPDVLNLLGLIAQAKGLQPQAEELFYFAIKQAPARAPFYYNLAFSFKLDGKPLEAIENFEKVIALQPEIKEAYNEIGLLHEGLGNPEKARQYWAKALEIDKDYCLPKINLANQTATEDFNKGIEALEELAREYPDEPLSMFYLTRLYMEAAEWDKAEQAVLKAESLVPVSDDLKVLLGQIMIVKDQPLRAKEYFEKARILNPQNVPALLNLADFSAKEENFELAEAYYKRVIELEPKNFDARNNYAGLLFKQKRTAEALEEYRQAVIINPKSAEVSNNLGIILRSAGDFEQALGLFFNALNLKPEMEDISVNIYETILMYHRNGSAEAVKIAENWLKSMPDNVFAKRLLAALEGEQSAGNCNISVGDSDICPRNIQISAGDNHLYSERLFDSFAGHYELVMQTLDFAVPMAMGRIAGPVEGRVVDIGCGTGLLGVVIKTAQNHLTGVDLSAKMLEKAAEKQVYDELIKDDAVSFLQKNEAFDWVMAADVLGYMGDLEEFVKAAKGSRLCFSSENANNGEDYKLDASGRYQHKPDYVRRVLENNGYHNITSEELTLRTENNEAVRGTIWKAE